MNFRTDQRGVSETISFVIVFSLVVTSVGVVYTVGTDQLGHAREYERLNNAERAFDVFADNVEDVTQRGAPSRGTEIKLADSSLRATTGTKINVTGDYRTGSTDAEDFATGNLTFAPIVFDVSDAGQIRYAGGAVLRDDGAFGNGQMTREPDFVLDDDRIVMTVVRFDHRGPASVGGSQTVRIRTERGRPTVVVGETDETYDNVSVRVTSPYPKEWAEYFKSEGLTCDPPEAATEDAPGNVTCYQTGVERLHVIHINLVTQFE